MEQLLWIAPLSLASFFSLPPLGVLAIALGVAGAQVTTLPAPPQPVVVEKPAPAPSGYLPPVVILERRGRR